MNKKLRIGAEWGELVPVVSPSDLRSVWKMMRDAQNKPGECRAVSSELFERVCSEGADVQAVWWRAGMLEALNHIRPETLRSYRKNGEFEDNVFLVAATIPMKNIEVGIPHHGLPFDLDGFLRRVFVNRQTNSSNPNSD
jgi:hypothetical protein